MEKGWLRRAQNQYRFSVFLCRRLLGNFRPYAPLHQHYNFCLPQFTRSASTAEKAGHLLSDLQNYRALHVWWLVLRSFLWYIFSYPLDFALFASASSTAKTSHFKVHRHYEWEPVLGRVVAKDFRFSTWRDLVSEIPVLACFGQVTC